VDERLVLARERLDLLLDLALPLLDLALDGVLGGPPVLAIRGPIARRDDLRRHDGGDGDRDQRGEREREREPPAQLHGAPRGRVGWPCRLPSASSSRALVSKPSPRRSLRYHTRTARNISGTIGSRSPNALPAAVASSPPAASAAFGHGSLPSLNTAPHHAVATAIGSAIWPTHRSHRPFSTRSRSVAAGIAVIVVAMPSLSSANAMRSAIARSSGRVSSKQISRRSFAICAGSSSATRCAAAASAAFAA